MLNENIKALRKAKGLSQEELAIKLSVVRRYGRLFPNGRKVCLCPMPEWSFKLLTRLIPP